MCNESQFLTIIGRVNLHSPILSVKSISSTRSVIPASWGLTQPLTEIISPKGAAGA
jgi:hypothetical protein